MGIFMSKPSKKRVVMAKKLARRWLKDKVSTEYRFTVYYGGREIKNLAGLLRSFRDSKLRLGSVEPLPDLGIKESFDSLQVWSSNRTALITLKDWIEGKGVETSGIW